MSKKQIAELDERLAILERIVSKLDNGESLKPTSRVSGATVSARDLCRKACETPAAPKTEDALVNALMEEFEDDDGDTFALSEYEATQLAARVRALPVGQREAHCMATWLSARGFHVVEDVRVSLSRARENLGK